MPPLPFPGQIQRIREYRMKDNQSVVFWIVKDPSLKIVSNNYTCDFFTFFQLFKIFPLVPKMWWEISTQITWKIIIELEISRSGSFQGELLGKGQLWRHYSKLSWGLKGTNTLSSHTLHSLEECIWDSYIFISSNVLEEMSAFFFLLLT